MPIEAERLQGFPVGWTVLETETDPEKLDTLRYHALGNAVTVPVTEWLAGRVMNYLGDEAPLTNEVEASLSEISGSEIFEEELV
jgi:DNA (cytosine-5)-methyltransferase 1